MLDQVTDWLPPMAFHRQFPNVHASKDSLYYELKHRCANGLIEDGVVVERNSNPNSSRPSLLISPSRYFERLTRLSKQALKTAT